MAICYGSMLHPRAAEREPVVRWLKHLSMAHSDEAIAYILEEYGAEGYGVWWLILEDIAAPMEAGKMQPTASHSVVKWSQICHCSVRRFRSIANRLAEKNLIQLQSDIDRIRIEVPNILKYKDEYSQKSGQHPDQERKQKQIENRDTEVDVSPSSKPKKPSRFSLEEFPEEWKSFSLLSLGWSPSHASETFERFKDYWTAQPKGTKMDWFAAWRYWCRNERQSNGVVRNQKQDEIEKLFSEARS